MGSNQDYDLSIRNARVNRFKLDSFADNGDKAGWTVELASCTGGGGEEPRTSAC